MILQPRIILANQKKSLILILSTKFILSIVKLFLTLSIIFFSLICYGSRGFSINDLSLLVGRQFRTNNQSIWGIELQFEKFSSGCVYHRQYYGFGMNYHVNSNQSEFGVKGMWNPTRRMLFINRRIFVMPYVFGQTNLIEYRSTTTINPDNQTFKGFSATPGIGLSGTRQGGKSLVIKTSIQAGYIFPFSNNSTTNSGFSFDFKIGIGINTWKLKKG